jgi:hypothetical protein
MRQPKILGINIAIATALIIGGCGGSGSPSNQNNKKINISFNGSNLQDNQNRSSRGERSLKAVNKLVTEVEIDDALLKINLRSNERGKLVNRYTPSQFILDIDFMVLTNESISSTLESNGTSTKIGRGLSDRGEKLVNISSDSGPILPKHYSMLHADKIIRNFGVKDLGYTKFFN